MKPAMKITAKDFGNGVLVKLQNPETMVVHVEYVEQGFQHTATFNFLGVVERANCVKTSVHTQHVNHIQLNQCCFVYYNREGYIDALQVVNNERVSILVGMKKAIIGSCYEAWDNEDDNNYLYNLETINLYEKFDPHSFENPKELKQKWTDLILRGWR